MRISRPPLVAFVLLAGAPFLLTQTGVWHDHALSHSHDAQQGPTAAAFSADAPDSHSHATSCVACSLGFLTTVACVPDGIATTLDSLRSATVHVDSFEFTDHARVHFARGPPA